MHASICYVFWSAAHQSEAKKVIHLLLDKRLIACGSIFPNVQSIYRWEGQIQEGTEAKVILKTVSQHFEAVQKTIKENCSYDVPEIVQMDLSQANPDYLSWMIRETTPSENEHHSK